MGINERADDFLERLTQAEGRPGTAHLAPRHLGIHPAVMFGDEEISYLDASALSPGGIALGAVVVFTRSRVVIVTLGTTSNEQTAETWSRSALESVRTDGPGAAWEEIADRDFPRGGIQVTLTYTGRAEAIKIPSDPSNSSTTAYEELEKLWPGLLEDLGRR